MRLRTTRGQAAIEYTLILCLLALACLGGVRVCGKIINKMYAKTCTVFVIPFP